MSQGVPGPPISDRPHTISSAYEKNHQRPLLQPYTFSPPDKTIPEEDERGVNGCQENGSEYATLRKPPVPGRQLSDQRPSLPGKTQAAMIAKQKLTQQQQQPGQLPNFQCNQPDMGELPSQCHESVSEGSFKQMLHVFVTWIL